MRRPLKVASGLVIVWRYGATAPRARGKLDDPCTRGAGPCFRIYEFSGVEKVDETAHGHGLPGTEDQMR